MKLSSVSPDHVGSTSLTSSLRAIGPSMPSTSRASPRHHHMAVQRISLAATIDRNARNDPEAVRRRTEHALACGAVTFFFFMGISAGSARRMTYFVWIVVAIHTPAAPLSFEAPTAVRTDSASLARVFAVVSPIYARSRTKTTTFRAPLPRDLYLIRLF